MAFWPSKIGWKYFVFPRLAFWPSIILREQHQGPQDEEEEPSMNEEP